MYPPLCGGGWCGVPSKTLRGIPIPPRPRQDRGDSGVSAAVWGWVVRCPLKSPRGIPIPPRPRQDRRDSGVSAAVWGRMVRCPLKTPTGHPYPSPAQAGPEGLGCIRRCVGEDGVAAYILHYLIHTHHIGLIEPLGGLAPPPWSRNWGASPYFITVPPPRGDTDSGVPHG